MEIEKIYIINTGESTEAAQANLVSKLNQCSFVEETGFEIININQFHNGMPDGYAMGPVEMTQAEIDEAITNRLIWEKIIFENIEMENRISLYSDYLNNFGNIDVDWRFQLEMTVNKYVKANMKLSYLPFASS